MRHNEFYLAHLLQGTQRHLGRTTHNTGKADVIAGVHQYDQTKLGAPNGFTVTVKNVKVSAGAGFIVVLTGDIMTMPGLPKVPAAEKIDVDENGKITGLF